MKFFKGLFFSFLMMFVFCNGYSQKQNFSFRKITVDDGLSNASVTKIMQDNRGFMWFATINGLNKYDGYKFTVYKNNLKDTNSLSDNRVESIFEDSENNIWVGTSFGLNLYNAEQDNFTRFFSVPNKNSISDNYLSQITETDSVLWFLTHGGGVNRFNKKTKKFTHFKHDDKDTSTIASDLVYSVLKDSKNKLWFGTNNGISSFNAETGKFINYSFATKNPSLNNIQCIFELAENDFLIGTDAGLLRFYPKNKNNNYIVYKYKPNDINTIKNDQVRDVFEDNSGEIWIASKYGLYIYNKKKDNFFKIQRNESNLNSISVDEFWDIEEDNQGNVWFGAFKGGLNILNTKQKKFKNWNYLPENTNGLSNNSVQAFAENDDGTLWIGVDHGGLMLFDRNKGNIKTYLHHEKNNQSISSNAVLCLLKDTKKKLWLGTWAGGMNQLQITNERFLHYSPPNIFFKNWHVWDIIEDSEGCLWIASHIGICKYNPQDDSYRTYFHDDKNKKSLSHNYTWTVFEDSKKNIWIGTTKGLNKYNKETDDFTFYPYRNIDGTELNSSTIYVIKEDNLERLWIGTSETGLNLFDKKSNTFKSFQESNELSKCQVYSIEMDKHNNLWLSTSNGLTKVKFDKNDSIVELLNFKNGNGINTGEFNVGASLKSKSGELFFGGSKGFVFFNPDSIKPSSFKPKVFITDFRIFNKKVLIDKKHKTNSPLRKHISTTKNIILDYTQSIFTLSFSALSYNESSKNQYAYKLDGLEDKWNYVQDKRFATYTNLNPGRYTFLVKASNGDGVWSDKVTSLEIEILPPWWKTIWAKILFPILIVGVFIAFYWNRVRSFKRQKDILEQNVLKRTQELKESNVFLEEKQQKILMQNKEIITKNKQLENQKNKIQEINVQLINNIQKLKESFEEQNKMEQKLIQSNKLASLGLLSAGIAHEINNPINFVYAGINSLMRDFEDLEPVLSEINNINTETDNLKEKFEYIQKLKDENYFEESYEAIPQIIKDIKLGAERTAEIVRGLQRFSRTDTSSFQNLDINDGIETALLLLKNKYKNHIEIIKNLDKNIPIYKCYPSKINQVFLNIISNAIDSISNQGKIWITTKLENSNIIISFKDSGCGISSDLKEKIFDPFFTTKSVGKGTGLGLSISYGSIKEHHGTIIFSSELGKGTEFIIKLPLQNN